MLRSQRYERFKPELLHPENMVDIRLLADGVFCLQWFEDIWYLRDRMHLSEAALEAQ